MLKNRFVLLVLYMIPLILSFCLTIDNIYGKDKLKVVTTAEFLADWTREIGKDLVDAESAHNGKVDMHFFEPRPKHVLMFSKADVFVTPGMDLDVWMQPLLDASRNSKIQYGAKGYIDASFGVHTLQKPPGRVDMSMGDIHPFGNPHYFYDLGNVGVALENITIGLSKVDPINSERYKANKESYWNEVQTTFKTLKRLLEPYKGTKVVAYHLSWEYFVLEFGFEIAGYFESKPGVPPTPKGLKNLMQLIKDEQIKIILKEPYYPKRPVKKVAKATGAKVLELINFPGGRENAGTYLENLKANVNDLIKALKEG